MRGKIVLYNSSNGQGVINTDAGQHDFTIRHWKSTSAPAVGQAVEITMLNEVLEAVFLVGADVRLKETIAQVSDMASNKVAAAGGGQAIAENALASFKNIGALIPLAYVIFVIAACFIPLLTVNIFGAHSVTLWKLAEVAGEFEVGGFGMVKPMIVLAALSIIVPVVWRDRRAYFAYLLPALTIVYVLFVGLVSYLNAMSEFNEMNSAMGGPGADVMRAMSSEIANSFLKAVSMGVSLPLLIVSAMFLAMVGINRAIRSDVSFGIRKIDCIAPVVTALAVTGLVAFLMTPSTPEKPGRTAEKKESSGWFGFGGGDDAKSKAEMQKEMDKMRRQQEIQRMQQQVQDEERQRQQQLENYADEQRRMMEQPVPVPSQADRDAMRNTNKKLEELLK
jgi:hypothetical protein